MLFLYRLICFVGYSLIVSKKFFFVLSSYYTTVWYVGVALQSVPKRVSIGGKLFWNEIRWENSQVLDVLEGSKIWKLLLLLLRVFFSKIRWYLSIYNFFDGFLKLGFLYWFMLVLFFIPLAWQLVFNPTTFSILMQEHTVRTGQGSVSVIVYGDQDKPALLTYPDLALNRERFVPHVFHFKLNYSLFAISTCFGTFVSLFTVHRLIL